MNSFIENVNYLASLDNKYGDRCEFLKTNLSLRNVSNNITFKASYFVYETMSIQSVEYSMTGAIYSDLTAILTGFKNVVDATGLLTSNFILSSDNNGFLVNSIEFNIDSLNSKVKLVDIEFIANQTVGGLQIYHLHGNVINSLKILPTLALFDQSILVGAIAIGEYSSEVVNVSNNIGNVNTAASNIINVNNVGNNITDVNTASKNIANINTSASSITNINLVGNSINNVNTAAINIDNVNDVANSILNVNTVATDISSVNTVSTNILNVNTTSANISNVNTVGNNIAGVVSTGNNISSVVDVAGSINNVNILAPNVSNINSIGPDISSVVTVANNIASVITDANSIGNINIVANDLSLAGYSNLLDAGSITESTVSDQVGISVIQIVAENITNVNSIVTQIIPNLTEILLADDNALTATTKAAEALASLNKAHKWADELENVPVVGTIGINDEYSAYHWAKKAESTVGGNINLDSLYNVDTAGILDGGIIRYDTATSTWKSYDFTHNNKLALDLTAGVAVLEGEIAWNSNEGTADLGLPNGSTLQIGQENIRTIRNATGSTISNGTLCMFDGTIGNSGRIKVKPFTAGFNEAMYLYGVATQNIISGSDGIITIEGKVRGIDTTGASVGEVWVDEDVLYAKPNDTGMMTNVEPLDNELKLVVATVIKAHTNGTLEIRFTPLNENMYYTKVQNDILLSGKVPLNGDFILDLGGL